MDAFFFPSHDGTPLFGVWRGAVSPERVWLLIPPFAEEEKSARRTLTEIARALETRGESSLLFSFRGTADSAGDFAQASFDLWRADLKAAFNEIKTRAPDAQIAVLGVRLGASLAILESKFWEENAVSPLVLIEPLLIGRSFLTQQIARKKMRAQLSVSSEPQAFVDEAKQAQTKSKPFVDETDLDGWPLSPALRADFTSLDLREVTRFGGESHLLQVGPRAEIAPNLESFAAKFGSSTKVIQMPAFWNLLDYTSPAPLLGELEEIWNA